MIEEQQASEHRHRRRRSRRSGSSSGRRRSSSSASSSKNKITLAQVLLLIWSVASMFTFLWMLEDEQRAPLSVAIPLALATVVGLLLFFRTLRKKK